jgi:hypothetical protein
VYEIFLKRMKETCQKSFKILNCKVTISNFQSFFTLQANTALTSRRRYQIRVARNHRILFDSNFLPLTINKLSTVYTAGINAKPKTSRTVYFQTLFKDLYATPNCCVCDILVGHARIMTSHGKRETCK